VTDAFDVPTPPGGWTRPWTTVIEVAGAIGPRGWLLVGGLMAQAHARAHGIDQLRPTDDVDLLVDIQAERSSLEAVRRSLIEIGFRLKEPGWLKSPAHRLTRGDDIVDVLVADHLPVRLRPRLAGYDAMPIDGGAQAASRRATAILSVDDGSVAIPVPSLLGALILKAAAAQTDSRDKLRHLLDAAVLASLLTDHKGALAELHGSDRRRLISLSRALSDPFHEAWLSLSPERQTRGRDTLRILTG
jgi:hypothetical protein